MAATEPVRPTVLAQLVEIPTDGGRGALRRSSRPSTSAKAAGSSSRASRAATASRRIPISYAYVERFVLEGQTARLSARALETLAIVAYKQPIGAAQLSAIRGVNVDATLKTLVQRGYVEEIGHEPTPGNPALFGTTSRFLERLGLDSLVRSSRARRLRSRGVDRRGARARPARARRRRSRARPSSSTTTKPSVAERPSPRPTPEPWSSPTASGCRRCSRARASGRAARARC